MPKFTSAPVFLEQFRQFLDHVLGLGHRHAMKPGNDGHVGGRLQDVVSVLRINRFDLTLDRGRLHLAAAEAAEQTLPESGSSPAHDLGEDDAGGAHQRTGHDQDIVVHRKARGAGRQAE